MNSTQVQAATLVAAGLGCMLMSVAYAQSATPAGDAAAAPVASGGKSGGADPSQGPKALLSLQEVVVTAERRSTGLQSTPIAITALTGEQLRTGNISDVSDLQAVVPSFQSNDQGGFHNYINIRGMGNSSILSTTIASGVPVFRDGILLSESTGLDEPMFDIADVEVLEGPQGTFVGANSTAGAVEINSVNPRFDGLSGYVSGGVGNYSATKWEGAVNLPVSDTFAVRIAFIDQQRNSFFKDEGSALAPGTGASTTDPGNQIARAARVSMLWKPTDSFQALGKVEYSYIDSDGDPGMPNPATYDTLFAAGPGTARGANPGCAVAAGVLNCPGPGAVTHSAYYYPGETPYQLDYYNTNTKYDELMTIYSLELRETLADGITLRSLSGMVHFDITRISGNSFGPLNGGTAYTLEGPNDNYYSQEFNIISPAGGRVDWIVGAFADYRRSPLGLQNLTVTPPYSAGELPATDSVFASVSTERMLAAFGQINWHITDTLQLQAGVRENHDNNFTTNGSNEAPAPGTIVPALDGTGVYSILYPTGGTAPSGYRVLTQTYANGSYKDSVPTGKVGLSWTPLPGQNFYAFYARGYKAGGNNQTSTDHPTFQPEHVNDYEAGWKGRIFDGHTLTQIGGYYVDYQNMQYSIFDADENNDTTVGDVVENLAPSKIYGIEVAAQSRFGGLGVNLGLDYNHSALGAITAVPDYQLPANFNTPIGHPQCLPGATYGGAVSCFNYAPYLENVSGEENPFSPEITGSIGLDYRFQVAGGVIDPGVTYSHTDRQWDSIFQDSRYNLMPARNLWNANVNWLMGNWVFKVYGTNLTNETYIIAGGNPIIYYGAPRQEGIQVTYHF
jgi:iron complex outermembrane recepter protein